MPTDPPHPDIAAAMTVLLARRRADLDSGAVAVGWKVGMNAPSAQDRFGLDGPIVGYLTDATELPPGRPVPITGWRQPMLEVEVAIRIGPGGSVASLAPALEFVDIDLPFDRIEPILEGNIFHRGVLFGTDSPSGEVTDLTVTVTRAGEEVGRGRLTEDPVRSVAVVRAFLGAHGTDVAPGERIIAGTLTPALPIAPGDHVDVSYGAIGSFSVDFT
jgi:2-keto-4-pentenoate hydratase